MHKLNIHEAKTKLSALLSRVEKGESFLICRNGNPIAHLIPHEKRKRTQPHPVMCQFKIGYDPTEELTEQEWSSED